MMFKLMALNQNVLSPRMLLNFTLGDSFSFFLGVFKSYQHLRAFYCPVFRPLVGARRTKNGCHRFVCLRVRTKLNLLFYCRSSEDLLQTGVLSFTKRKFNTHIITIIYINTINYTQNTIRFNQFILMF